MVADLREPGRRVLDEVAEEAEHDAKPVDDWRKFLDEL
jgi:hypothetical protein